MSCRGQATWARDCSSFRSMLVGPKGREREANRLNGRFVSARTASGPTCRCTCDPEGHADSSQKHHQSCAVSGRRKGTRTNRMVGAGKQHTRRQPGRAGHRQNGDERCRGNGDVAREGERDEAVEKADFEATVVDAQGDLPLGVTVLRLGARARRLHDAIHGAAKEVPLPSQHRREYDSRNGEQSERSTHVACRARTSQSMPPPFHGPLAFTPGFPTVKLAKARSDDLRHLVKRARTGNRGQHQGKRL